MAQLKVEVLRCSNCKKTIFYWGEELPPCSCNNGAWEKLSSPKNTRSGVHVGSCSKCGGSLVTVPGGVMGYRCTKCGHFQLEDSRTIGF